MDFLSMSQTDSGLHIDGFPDAVKVIALAGDAANEIADLSLHQRDLTIASAAIQSLNNSLIAPIIQEALWTAALVHFFKCFSSGSRNRLSAETVFAAAPPEALEAFRYLKALRDKHLVHDVNGFSQVTAGAVIAAPGKSYKIEKIVCVTSHAVSLDVNFGNCSLLIQDAATWVKLRYDQLCSDLTPELEGLSYEDLLAFPPLSLESPPPINEITKPRSRGR
jgi:hypothetical protein